MYLYLVGQYSDTRTLITRVKTRLNKTLFLRTHDDHYRRRHVVDHRSLWKERPLLLLNVLNVTMQVPSTMFLML